MSDWKSKLASKFNRNNKDYDVLGTGGDDGVNIESYKKTSDEFGEPITAAPRTEPLRRKHPNMQNGSAGGASRGIKDDPNKHHAAITSSGKRLTVASSTRGARGPVVENGRRVSTHEVKYC